MLVTSKDDSDVDIYNSAGEKVAGISLNRWESDFIGKKIGMLKFDLKVLLKMPISDMVGLLDKIAQHIDSQGFVMTELTTSILAIKYIPILEDFGFRLVDTRMTFITLMDNKFNQDGEDFSEELRFARKEDLESVLELTKQSFIENPEFKSRFKNRDYFTVEQSNNYYAAWIENHIDDENSFFIVLVKNQNLIGYYIYKDKGEYKGKKIYKGLLAAVDKEHRGKHLHLMMQKFIYRYLEGGSFYVDNTTQLTNYAVIKNHISSNKKLDRIELTFYRSKQ